MKLTACTMRSVASRRDLRALVILLALIAGSLSLHAQTPRAENLGPGVNSAGDDLSPMISPDGRTLYLQRSVPPKRAGVKEDFDIYVSTLKPDGTWSQATALPWPVNTWAPNSLSGVSADGSTLFLYGQYSPDGSVQPGFSITHRNDTGWSWPEPVVVEKFFNRNKYVNPQLSNDGRMLMLGIEAGDSRGDQDIYVSFRRPDGSYSQPLNLGDDINTSGAETSPFLASDGVTLYFASDGRGGAGDLDIFVTRRLDSTWKRWSKPVNLGAPFNTSRFDAYYAVDASGRYAYYVSFEHTLGGADIFRAELPRALQPKAMIVVRGRVIDHKSRKPLAATIRFAPEAGRDTVAATAGDGLFTVTLPAGSHYRLAVGADKHYALDTAIEVRVQSGGEMALPIELAAIAPGSTIRLDNITFSTGITKLEGSSSPELDRVVALMNEYPTMKIDIAGHTDSVGIETKNMRLSVERASAVAQYLLAHGVDTDRLGWAGFGESRPIADNGTKDGRRRNRRVEFTIRKDE